MAAAHDAVSNPTQGFTADTSWTHTPTGTPRGVLVVVVGSGQSDEEVAGGTYGGDAMTAVEFQGNTNLEAGAAHVFFLGTSVPTGAQTVAIDLAPGATGTYAAWAYTLTAAADTEVAASGVSNADADPSVTLATLAGFAGVAYGGCFSRFGTDAAVDPGTGYTEVFFDFGAATGMAEHGAKSGANVVVNWTGADWHAMVALAVQEAAGGGTEHTVGVAGAITPAGTFSRSSGKQLAGMVATAGVVAGLVSKVTGGAATPAGALTRSTSKQLAGATVPAGVISRSTNKQLGGGLTPTGALSLARVLLLALAGAIAPSGTLGRSTAKGLGGGSTPSGALSRSTSKQLGGVVAPAGSLRKLAGRLFAGALAPVGALVTAILTPSSAVPFDPGTPSQAVFDAGSPGLGYDAGSAPAGGFDPGTLDGGFDPGAPG